MTELTWMLDTVTGQVIVEGLTPEEADTIVGDLLSAPRELACAVPLTLLPLPPASDDEIAAQPCLRIAGYYHHGLIEGPGRRSVAKMVGCPIRCKGCIARDTWDPNGGSLVTVDRLADALLDPTVERDGVTILGGEPMFQPDGLLALVRTLRTRGCPHLVVYSGYTYDRLLRMADAQPSIAAILAEIDLLIDGPFIAALADQCGPWTGSRNQRRIDLAATRQRGSLCLWSPSPSR